QARLPGGVHPDRDPRRLGGRGGRREGVPGGRARAGVLPGGAGAAAAGEVDADRRGGPDDGRGVPAGRGVLPGGRGSTRRCEGGGGGGLRGDPGTGAAVRRGREAGTRDRLAATRSGALGTPSAPLRVA